MRDNVKRVRIPIEEGVKTAGTDLARGIFCETIANLIHRYAVATSVKKGFSPPDLPKTETAMTDANDCFGMGFFTAIAGAITDLTVGIDTSTTPDKATLYNAATGAKIGAAGQLEATALTFPFNITYFSHNAAPLTFIGTRNPTTARIWEYDGTTLSTYSNATLNSAKEKNTVFAYLLRIWIAEMQNEGSTFLFFTDVLDTTSIRSGNFVRIPDAVNVLAIESAGDVDVSAQSHLIVGCDKSIWVLDGAPQTGTLIRRALSTTVGIDHGTHIAETDFGLVFIGTDGRLYLIPRGAAQIVPIGGDIEDRIAAANPISTSLMYRSPYLYVFAQTDTFIGDFSDGQTFKWWGPNPNKDNRTFKGGLFTGEIIVRACSEVGSVYSLGLEPLSADRLVVVETGDIHEPGHDVAFGRVTFKGLHGNNGAVHADLELTVTDPEEATKTAKFAIPINGVAENRDFKTSLTVPGGHIRGRHFRVKLSTPATVAPAIGWSSIFEEAEIEYRVIPRVD